MNPNCVPSQRVSDVTYYRYFKRQLQFCTRNVHQQLRVIRNTAYRLSTDGLATQQVGRTKQGKSAAAGKLQQQSQYHSPFGAT